MRIDHIAMYVNDLEAARNFFVNYLGAVSNDGYHNQTTDFRSYFLTFDGGTRLEIMHKPELEDGPKALSRTGFIHVAFGVGSRWSAAPEPPGTGIMRAVSWPSRGTRSN